MPPSTTKLAPVMNLAAGDARYRPSAQMYYASEDNTLVQKNWFFRKKDETGLKG